MKAYMEEMFVFCDEHFRIYGKDASILCVTSGARMGPMRALAQGYNPRDEKEMFDWVMAYASPTLGEVWVFEYDMEKLTFGIQEITLEELRQFQA